MERSVRELNLIRPSGTFRTDGPNLMTPFLMKIWKSEVGIVPANFTRWLLNQTISFASDALSCTLYVIGVRFTWHGGSGGAGGVQLSDPLS